MKSKKASSDYIRLRTILGKGFRPTKININFGNGEEECKIDLEKEGEKPLHFISNSDDVVMFGFKIKGLYDFDGGLIPGEIKDLGLFYETLQKFYDPDNVKFHTAGRELATNSKKVQPFHHYHKLLKKFLEEKNLTKYRDYLSLRDDYYLIKFLQIDELKQIYDGMTHLSSIKAPSSEVFGLVQDVFKRAFHINGNFLKNYQFFHQFITDDAIDILFNSNDQVEFNDSHMRILSEQKGIKARVGLRHIIQQYAATAENIIKLLNVVRAGVEIIRGTDLPKPYKSSVENWDIIKNDPDYWKIVDGYDPRVRHGSAHNNYFIDEENRLIKFFNEGRVKEVSFEYSFDEFREMWHKISYISTGLIVGLCVEQSVLTALAIDSKEYKLLLSSLGNFSPMPKNKQATSPNPNSRN